MSRLRVLEGVDEATARRALDAAGQALADCPTFAAHVRHRAKGLADEG